MFQNAFFLTGEIKWGVGEGNKKRKKKSNLGHIKFG